MSRPILCLDFDGVLHSYTSGWSRIDVVQDPPTPHAAAFLESVINTFEVHIFSSRSKDPRGIEAMQNWLKNVLKVKYGELPSWYNTIKWPTDKPAAFLTIDDRALTFNGTWPKLSELVNFKPWNRRR